MECHYWHNYREVQAEKNAKNHFYGKHFFFFFYFFTDFLISTSLPPCTNFPPGGKQSLKILQNMLSP